LVPLGCEEDLDTIDGELVEIMKALATAHFKDHVDEVDLGSFTATPLLGIKSFQRSLSEDLRETAYQRYSNAWVIANNKPTIPASTQKDPMDERKRRSAAAELRKEAWLNKRRRIDHGEDGNRKEGGTKGRFNEVLLHGPVTFYFADSRVAGFTPTNILAVLGYDLRQ
jgi:hypothetical protein